MTKPQDANQLWGVDFVSNTLGDGRRFHILCVIDDFYRARLATVVDNSIPGSSVDRELDAIPKLCACPAQVHITKNADLTI